MDDRYPLVVILDVLMVPLRFCELHSLSGAKRLEVGVGNSKKVLMNVCVYRSGARTRTRTEDEVKETGGRRDRDVGRGRRGGG